MANITQIMMQVDYAYGLLNQKTVVHFGNIEHVHVLPKPVTNEDIAKVKEILRDTYGDLKAMEKSLREITGVTV